MHTAELAKDTAAQFVAHLIEATADGKCDVNGEAELAYFLEVVRLHVVSRFVERWVTDEKAG